MDGNFGYGYITRQDIVNFPFPYKLWLVINLENCDCLRWNRDGTIVLLDLVALEEYLNSTRSIFKIKNSSSFLKHLLEFMFERLNSKPEAEEDVVLQYKNENFQRHRIDLLPKIRRHIYEINSETGGNNSKESDETTSFGKLRGQYTNTQNRVSERMLGDLCFMGHGGLSKIKKSRLQFQTTLHFNNEKRALKKKLEASENAHNSKSTSNTSTQSSFGTLTSEDDQVIELPIDLFENPHDSVLSFDFLPEYAGYYGNCNKDQIIHFFGEYLPMYEDGSMGVKKVMTDNCNSSTDNTRSIKGETNIEQYYSPVEALNSNLIISTPLTTDSMYNMKMSSNLEPIFVNNGNCENVNNCGFTITHLNSDCLSNDDDISMDEFLKFNDSRRESVSVNSQEITGEGDVFDAYKRFSEEQDDDETFPQMPTSFKIEINEDVKENEANFRNFFSQYRASLNLLYDRQ